MTELFRNNTAKFYFYKYEKIGTTIPKIKDVTFSTVKKEVYITTEEEIPREMPGILAIKTSERTCLYTFPSEPAGLMPIENKVFFD